MLRNVFFIYLNYTYLHGSQPVVIKINIYIYINKIFSRQLKVKKKYTHLKIVSILENANSINLFREHQYIVLSSIVISN